MLPRPPFRSGRLSRSGGVQAVTDMLPKVNTAVRPYGDNPGVRLMESPNQPRGLEHSQDLKCGNRVRVPGTRFRVPGIGYRLSGTWDLVPGTGAGPTPRAGYRAPKTESEDQVPENAHTGFASIP
jgi:hypothetical protein